MKNRLRFVTQTAIMLAILVSLQALTRAGGQILTGSCVNAVLAICVLTVGLASAITVASVSPVLAFFLGIAPNLITVVPIMMANVCYVVLLYVLIGKKNCPLWRQIVGLAAAAVVKLGVLYVLVVEVICGVAAGALLGKKIGQVVVLAPPMLTKLPAMFTWPQLVTALIGGAVALAVMPVLRKALRKFI